MKCPKCGYLGFETTDRCRNCGYDFSLAERPPAAKELALRDEGAPEEPLGDFDLSGTIAPRATPEPPMSLDLRIDPVVPPSATPPSLGEFSSKPEPAAAREARPP